MCCTTRPLRHSLSGRIGVWAGAPPLSSRHTKSSPAAQGLTLPSFPPPPAWASQCHSSLQQGGWSLKGGCCRRHSCCPRPARQGGPQPAWQAGERSACVQRGGGGRLRGGEQGGFLSLGLMSTFPWQQLLFAASHLYANELGGGKGLLQRHMPGARSSPALPAAAAGPLPINTMNGAG